jgi:RNA polymerase sigma-70 factor (ECF subfamily)
MSKEEILVKKIIGGDKQAFRWFYKNQELGLGKFVSSKISNKEDAEEVAQDIWLSFLDSLPLFRFGSSLRTFLWSIARHEVADYYRRKYAKRVIKLVPLVDKVYQENSVKQIAQKLGASFKTVESKLFRARKAFQMAYLELQEVEEVSEVARVARVLKVGEEDEER